MKGVLSSKHAWVHFIHSEYTKPYHNMEVQLHLVQLGYTWWKAEVARTFRNLPVTRCTICPNVPPVTALTAVIPPVWLSNKLLFCTTFLLLMEGCNSGTGRSIEAASFSDSALSGSLEIGSINRRSFFVLSTSVRMSCYACILSS